MTGVIETKRLILRPLTLDDAEAAFCVWTSDADAMKYVSWLPHASIKETIEWLKEIEWKYGEDGSIAKNDNYIWGFELKETGKLIGSGGLIWENEYRIFQVGYNIGKNYWGNGYTTEAMRAIICFARLNLGLERLMGGHAKDNIASARVLKKLGFVYHHDSLTPHIDGTRVFDSKEYMLDLEISNMKIQDVIDLLNASANIGVKLWFTGGWGVDALMERQTRQHGDIDIFLEKKNAATFLEMLAAKDYGENTEKSTVTQPVWSDAYDRAVDMKLFEFKDAETMLFEGKEYPFDIFDGQGVIGGVRVNCMSAKAQVQYHKGYARKESDVHDVLLLCKEFGISVPLEYETEEAVKKNDLAGGGEY